MQDNNQQAGIAVVSGPSPFRIEEDGGMVKLTLHGLFDSVEENTRLISEIHAYADKYNIIEVWISSDGGMFTMLNEIIEALKQYQTVVTICNSTASSAGAMVWGLGHMRVVSPFTQLLWHRESYGFFGKTDQHEDQLEMNKKVFPILMNYCVGDILTPEEIDKARYTEIHKTGQEMIESGHAISFEDYRERMNQSMNGRFVEVGTVFYDQVRGCMVLSTDDGDARTVGDLTLSPYKYSFFDSSISNTVRVTHDADEEDDVIETEIYPEELFNDLDCEFLETFDLDLSDEEQEELMKTFQSTNEESEER